MLASAKIPPVGTLKMQATLQPRGPAAAVVLDDAAVQAVGEGAKRFPVRATVNGYTWRTSVARMRGEFLVGLSREVREAAGVEAGDTVEVELVLDAAPREVDVPAQLAEALEANPAALAAFDALAYTHRKEYARWVDEAKREDTRERRIAKAIEMLLEGRTRS
ncbi:MAG: YdeI/OmpD-associated family protein [Solirubrobacteraceae bacterium]